MSSINSPSIVAEMLRNNGTYPGDPQMFAIFSYTNNWGGQTYKLCRNVEVFAEGLTSPHVHFPVVLWTAKDGLTEDGDAFLQAHPEIHA